MKRGNILAHRGLWTDAAQKNSRSALRSALELGFGVETDFRDSLECLCVSHDPVSKTDTLTAAQFFGDYAATKSCGRLALNIKADGLQELIVDVIEASKVPVENVFVFDMSVPDTLGYVRRAFPMYSRVSEYEPHPSLFDDATGVWVDNFTGDFPQVSKAIELLGRERRVCIVSPELHNRPHLALWDEISAAKLHEHPNFELCTDFPIEADRRLGSN